jgi:hypothetical protein
MWPPRAYALPYFLKHIGQSNLRFFLSSFEFEAVPKFDRFFLIILVLASRLFS